MRGEVGPQSSMSHYFSVEFRIPADHPLRPVKKLANSALSSIFCGAGSALRKGLPTADPAEATAQGPIADRFIFGALGSAVLRAARLQLAFSPVSRSGPGVG